VTNTRTLSDYLELAAKRRETESGRRLAEIAQAEGHDISHSTVNRIRKGDYLSAPTTAILKAIAFLSKEPETAVFAAAADKQNAADIDAAFEAWYGARQRLVLLTDRYARLRGITTTAAERELQSRAQQLQRGDQWHRDADVLDLAAARSTGAESEGARRRRARDQAAESVEE
jgi:hypothetical protein